MVQHVSRHSDPDAPKVEDLAPDFVGEEAEAIVTLLYALEAAELLDWYRPVGRDCFNVWLPDAVVRGGRRLELREWAREYGLPTVQKAAQIVQASRRDQEAAVFNGQSVERTPRPRWWLRLRTLVAAALGLSLLLTSLSACAGPTPDPPSAAVPSSVPTVAVPTHRNLLTVGYCTDGTWSVPTSLFVAANRFVADSIDDAVTLNQDGLVVYVTYVAEDPFLPQNTPLTIQVPAISAPPPAPTILPTPTADPNNVWAHNNAVATVTAHNAQATQQYEATLSQLQTHVTGVRGQVKQKTDQLRNLPRPSSDQANRTSLWSCLELQAQRLQQSPGSKMLVIQSDFTDNQPQQALSGVQLTGVRVVAIFMNCTSGGECRATQDSWSAILRSMHAASVQFHDPGSSATLPPLFGGSSSGK